MSLIMEEALRTWSSNAPFNSNHSIILWFWLQDPTPQPTKVFNNIIIPTNTWKMTVLSFTFKLILSNNYSSCISTALLKLYVVFLICIVIWASKGRKQWWEISHPTEEAWYQSNAFPAMGHLQDNIWMVGCHPLTCTVLSRCGHAP